LCLSKVYGVLVSMNRIGFVMISVLTCGVVDRWGKA